MTTEPYRFAAIADTHGNLRALEAVLDDIQRQGITDIVNLGDHFSGPLEAVGAGGSTAMAALADIEAAADGIDYPLILCGHTHIPRTVRLRDGRMIVNPGSVGCPGYEDDQPVFHIMEAGTPLASYAILEKSNDRWSVGFRQIPYDNMSMAALAEQRGRPEWARALATGWITA